MNNKLDALLKTTNETSISSKKSKQFLKTKHKFNSICEALSTRTKDYNPAKTIENINKYLLSEEKLDGVLYSEISTYIYCLETTSKGIFTTNVEKLLTYALDTENSDVTDDCRKIVVKIYDHSQLAINQMDNIKTIFESGIEETKISLKDEIKGVEKEYISILGIFASIVFAFVGGITFSSSVLQNIGNVGIYRLLTVIVLLAFILVNSIWILIKFIAMINDKNIKLFSIKGFNITCLVFTVLVFISWILNIQDLANYLHGLLPWCK